jgi:two-component system, NtrC family, response regulator AtoC
MTRILSAVMRVAPRDVTVLVRGETGTGKELVASLLHAESRRKERPLVRFNCAALPAELAESELFGHARGAFTGATHARQGFFARADGGTLVLDEVGELPLALQAKLLRALQEGEIQPVGAGRVDKVDVRIVASTNRDLVAEVKRGAFREDLYYRLAVVEIVVPPLRERREDIPPLVHELARRYADRFAIESLELTPRLVDKLAAQDWPGNVRQLENTIARLAALSDGGTLDVDALPDANIGAKEERSRDRDLVVDDDDGAAEPPGAEDGGPSLKEQVEAFERNLIAKTLTAVGHNQSAAARKLGTSRVTILDKVKRYGLANLTSRSR